jgi:hypothetical protein
MRLVLPVVKRMPPYLRAWGTDVGNRAWWLIGVVVAVDGLVTGIIEPLRAYYILAFTIALGILLVCSLLAYRRLHIRSTLRISDLENQINRQKGGTPRREVQPPGGGLPFAPPVEYQVNALRQLITKFEEMGLEYFNYKFIDSMIKNYQREGTDPVYEPLHPASLDEGIRRLVELNEIEALDQEGQTAALNDLGPQGSKWIGYRFRRV